MKITLYHIDAFTKKIFHGNPAAVCVLPEWLADEDLHAIAKENNLPVTTFLVQKEKKYYIRWITPEYELDICGHGSLSAGHVIFNYLEQTAQEINLHSPFEILSLARKDQLITLNFPVKNNVPYSNELLEKGLGLVPQEIYAHKNERCLLVYATEEDIEQLKPNMGILQQLPHRGVTVTAIGKEVDFVSRTFYPQKAISEDPATGASHCLLVPYWSQRLNKKILHAKQLSRRGGEMFCELQGDRVLISGNAVTYLRGTIEKI